MKSQSRVLHRLSVLEGNDGSLIWTSQKKSTFVRISSRRHLVAVSPHLRLTHNDALEDQDPPLHMMWDFSLVYRCHTRSCSAG